MQEWDKDMEKKKISPDEYRKILLNLEINAILLKNSKTLLDDRFEFKPGLEVSINTKAQYKNVKDDRVIIEHSYSLIARQPGGKLKMLEIDATYKIELRSKYQFTDEIFEIYKEGNLMFNTWPYFREFVNNMTSRMNIPPLTLPFIKR